MIAQGSSDIRKIGMKRSDSSAGPGHEMRKEVHAEIIRGDNKKWEGGECLEQEVE